MKLIAVSATFLIVCLITAFVGFIKGRMKKLNKEIEKANHYDDKLSQAGIYEQEPKQLDSNNSSV